MIGTRLLYTNPQIRTIEVTGMWTDTVTASFFEWTNYAPHAVAFQRCEFINGTTAGSSDAGVITVSTPNCDYTLTGPATLPAGHPIYCDNIGLDRIEEGQTIKAVMTAAAGSGKEFKFRLILSPVGPLEA